MVETLHKNLFLVTWCLVAVLALATRVPLPIDETRYLSVAWEMWQRGSFLVPYLNGEPYSHKPPLLFWLFEAGWAAVGVNAWWPRMVVLLTALAAYFALRSLVRSLWPGHRELPEFACLLLGGAVLWTLFSAFIMFDLLLSLWVIVGMTGLGQALAGNRRGWWLLGGMLGLGVLTKGPVVLLHLLLPALLAPAWSPAARGNLRGWYADAMRALLIGAAVALAWALPAAYAGGEAYREALLWKQTAGRVVGSFAHRRPWWTYALFLPLALLPWVLWKPAWRAVRASIQSLDGGTRFCLAWMVPVVLSLSLVSGKQPQYLLPILPPAVLLAARALSLSYEMVYRPAMFAAVLPFGVLGFLLAVGPLLPGDWHQGWLEDVSPLWGIAAIAAVAYAMAPSRLTTLEATRRLHITAVLVPSLLAAAALGSVAGQSFDVAPAARAVRQMQDRGGTVAFWGDYHGQLNFVGRLAHPLPELRDEAALSRLVATTPGARVLVFSRKEPQLVSGLPPEAAFRYRRHYLSLWPAQQLLAQPELLERLTGSLRPPTPADDLR